MKHSSKTTLLASAIVLSLGLVTTPIFAAGESTKEAKELIAEAKMSLKRADSAGGAWRDTAKIIKKAEKLLADGKPEQAAKQAYIAIEQGLLGYDQAVTQAKGKLHI